MPNILSVYSPRLKGILTKSASLIFINASITYWLASRVKCFPEDTESMIDSIYNRGLGRLPVFCFVGAIDLCCSVGEVKGLKSKNLEGKLHPLVCTKIPNP
jgi:hypothetical protein